MSESDAAAATQESNGVSLTRMSLRPGGWIGYSDDAVFIDRDDERVKIRNADISQIGLRVIEWDVAVMSLLLVGIGVYVGVTRNVFAGTAFGAIGVASVYYTYSQRYELVIQVKNRPKPVTLYPTHPKECHSTLVEAVGLEAVR